MNLHDLITDEPPCFFDADTAILAGRRRRRRTRTALVASAALSVGAVVSLAMLGGRGAAPTSSVLAAQPTASTAAADSGELDNAYYSTARVHTPADWSFTNATVDGDGWWADVTDDQGHGPGRFGIFRSAGGLQQHPCSDSEFVAGAASCSETMLDADTRLIVRSVSRTNPINDLQVVIVHANGYGVNVSDNNAVWPLIPPDTIITTEAQKRRLTHGTVGSAEPIYSLDALVQIAKDVDASPFTPTAVLTPTPRRG